MITAFQNSPAQRKRTRNKGQKVAKKPIIGSIGIVVSNGRILISKRRKNDTLGGYWEFPGGKRTPGESAEDCLHREILEELGITVKIVRSLKALIFDYPTAKVMLHPFVCRHLKGKPKPLESQQVKWVSPAALKRHKFPPANDDLLSRIASIISEEA